MIDHIGTKRVSIRALPGGGLGIRLLNRDASLDLTADEWFELLVLAAGIKAVVDFTDAYSPS